MSCPDVLPREHARILRYKTSKKLIAKYVGGAIEWDDKGLKIIRDAIRFALRDGQKQRCYYCRRMIPVQRRNVGEAIEHFLDKSKPHYRRWGLNPLNLVIACQPCNIVKSTKDLGDAAVRSAQFLSPGSGNFSWPHPYFDRYGENIRLAPGPVYSAIIGAPRFDEAVTMIGDLKLSSIPNLDDRVQLAALEIQRLQAKLFRLTAPIPHAASKRREMVRHEVKLRLDKFMFEVFGI